MYSREEAAKIKQEFWTAFGKYMQPVPCATGEKINWVNYKTGIKGIQIRKNAEQKQAFIAIEIRTDEALRKKYFEVFKMNKELFSNDWDWYSDGIDEHGRKFSYIIAEKNGFNIFNKENWPELISFFKEKMIMLDSFWAEQKDIFEMLG